MDFYQLDTDAQVDRLLELASRALENWTLDADRLDLIKYRENAVFRLMPSISIAAKTLISGSSRSESNWTA